MIRRALVLGAVMSLMLIAVCTLAAQRKSAGTSTGTSTLTGLVIGPDDKPVPHAAITYQSSGGNEPHAVHTDSKGHFTISHLKADNYDIRASSKGIFSEWMKNVTLPKGQTRTVEMRLVYAREIRKANSSTKPKS